MDIARLEKLPGLNSDEKGKILAGLMITDDKKVERLFTVSDDATLGAALRTMFLQPSESWSLQQKIDIMITKIDEMLHGFFHATSKTRAASSINDDDLKKLRESIRVEEPIYKHSSGRFLHNVPVESLSLVRRQHFWTPDKSETQHRTAYMDYLRSKFKAEGFEWIDTNAPGQNYILKSNFNELAPFKVSAKNDALLCRNGCSFSAGASVGIELKRDLTEKLTEYLRQAETEFYLWADASKYAFTQVLTDLECGGAAFYYNGEDVVCEVFFGMQELEASLKKNLEESGDAHNAPGKRGPDAAEGGQRKRFRPGSLPRYGQIGGGDGSRRYDQIGGSGGGGGSGEGGPTSEQVALWMLGSRIMNNLDDVANDSDFVGMNIPELCSF